MIIYTKFLHNFYIQRYKMYIHFKDLYTVYIHQKNLYTLYTCIYTYIYSQKVVYTKKNKKISCYRLLLFHVCDTM